MTPRPKLKRLSADCPIHGKVRVVCPRCAGKMGGRGRRRHRQNIAELKLALGLLETEFETEAQHAGNTNAGLDATEQFGDGQPESSGDNL